MVGFDGDVHPMQPTTPSKKITFKKTPQSLGKRTLATYLTKILSNTVEGSEITTWDFLRPCKIMVEIHYLATSTGECNLDFWLPSLYLRHPNS